MAFWKFFYYVYKLMPDFVSVNAMESSTKEITSFLHNVYIEMFKMAAPFLCLVLR